MSGPLSRWFKIPTLADRLRGQGVREDLVQAAERTVFSRQGDRGLAELAAALDDAEGVSQLVEGRNAGADGLLLLTSRRLLFAPKAADRSAMTVLPLPDVQSVQWRMHRGLGVLEVDGRSGTLLVDQILGNQAESLGRNVRLAMNPPGDGPAAARDPLEELAELRAMHQAGAISDAEFQIRKHQLFGQI